MHKTYMQTILFYDDENVEVTEPPLNRTRCPRARKRKPPKKVCLDDFSIDDESSIHIPNPEIAPIYSKNSDNENEINKAKEKDEINEDELQKIIEIEKLQQRIIRLPGHKLEFNLIPYEFHNTKKIKIHGSHLYYQLLKNGDVCCTCKVKNISKSDDINLNSAANDAKLSIIDNNQTYVLFVSNQQKMEITFQLNEIKNCPRHCRLIFFDQIKDIEPVISRKRIQVFGDGIWIMDLNGRKGIKSAKNCILVDSKQNEIMSIMRTDYHNACIEAHPNIPEICVFAFGIASYICPFK